MMRAAVLFLGLALACLSACDEGPAAVAAPTVDAAPNEATRSPVNTALPKAAALQPQSDQIEEVGFIARVVGVIDGDTIEVLDAQNRSQRVRLDQLDAPERGQPWNELSKRALSDLVFNKEVRIIPVDQDRYGRLVAEVWVGELNVSRELISLGAAHAFRRYLRDQSLIEVEAEARRNARGLWSLPPDQQVPPWEWRAGARTAAETPLAVQPLRSAAADQAGQGFTCGKRFCRQMSSCAEARFHLQQCGVSRLDGDGDGTPCETLC